MSVIPTGLTAQDLLDRQNFIGGSDATIIMTGTPQEVQNLIDFKRGERPGKNLDNILAVRMGIVTEDLNRYWYTKQTGRAVTHAGERRNHFLYDWQVATLDGLTMTSEGDEAVFEAKHTGERNSIQDLVERYFWQLLHAMEATGRSWAVLSAFFGNGNWDMAEVAFSQEQADLLLEREKVFWDCRMTGKRWPDLPPPPRPDIEQVLKTSKPCYMGESNEWCSLAPEWRELKMSARRFDEVSSRLKALVNREVRMSFARGVIARCDKRGVVTLIEDKDWDEEAELLRYAVANDDDLTY